MAKNYLNLMKNITHPQSWTNFKKDKLKQIHTYTHHGQFQDKDKRKFKKQEERTPYAQGKEPQ